MDCSQHFCIGACPQFAVLFVRINNHMGGLEMLPSPQSKTPETERAYQKVTQTVLRHAERLEANGDLPAIEDRSIRLAATVLELEVHVQPSTFRQYKAAVLHSISIEPTELSDAAREMLDPEWTEDHTIRQHEIELARKANLTRLVGSQQRADHLSPQDWGILLNALLASKSQYGVAAALWLVAIMEAGLRPCEWASVEVKAPKTLVVRNAKATNGRAHGETRTLSMFRAEAPVWDAISDFLEIVRNAGPEGFQRLYNGSREVIATEGRRALSARKTYPALYTARDHFASRAKSTFTKAAVAALMGHGSIGTAPRHYAPSRHARGGRPLAVQPSPNDVHAVELRRSAQSALRYISGLDKAP